MIKKTIECQRVSWAKAMDMSVSMSKLGVKGYVTGSLLHLRQGAWIRIIALARSYLSCEVEKSI